MGRIKALTKHFLIWILKNLYSKSEIVKVNLKNVHIKSAKLLENRSSLLTLMKKNAIVAEIGVAEGDFSREILQITQPQKLHLVDCWGSKRYHSGLKLLVENKFENEIKNEIVEVHKGLSTDMVSNFSDNYFDWIYIDTDHTYHTTLSELRLYAPKVKPDGIIAGHDYIMGNWEKYFKYGVIEAVHQFCVEENWEIVYLTMEGDNAPSFALKRIY